MTRSQSGKTQGEAGTPGYVRAAVAESPGYTPGEQPIDPRVVKLNTNENPYPPSPRVRQAILDACTHLHLYPDPSASQLRQRMAALCQVDAAGVVVGNGSDELLAMLFRAVIDPGAAVAYPVPTYSLYDTLVELQDAVAIKIPFPDDFAFPRRLFETGARMLIVCNPNSPSGTLTPTEMLDDLATRRRDAVVVIDEAYVDFAARSSVGLVLRHPNVVVLRTLSKSYSLAGLRVGFALTNPALASQIIKVKDSYNVSRLAQAGGLAALEDQETMLGHVAQVRATRARLSALLRELGFSVLPSEANFVLARRPGESLAPLAEKLRERGILVRAFSNLPDALRISVGTDEQIDRLLLALRQLGKG